MKFYKNTLNEVKEKKIKLYKNEIERSMIWRQKHKKRKNQIKSWKAESDQKDKIDKNASNEVKDKKE